MWRVARVAAVVCALLMVLVVFQSHGALAVSCKDWYGYNRASASCGGVATAIGSTSPNTPMKANDGDNSTYWQSSTTAGWLAVRFSQRFYINQVHVHFLLGSTIYPKLSVYVDKDGNGKYDANEATNLTSNAVRDVIINVTTAFALGVSVTIGAKAGNINPKIAEVEAYLLNDSDGDGLTNDQETSTVYYQDMGAGSMPSAIPDAEAGVSSTTVSLAPFSGIPQRALANFTVDHTSKSDLSATVGYWNGTDWTDYLVWDPGIEVRGVRINEPDLFEYYSGMVRVAAQVKDPDTTWKVEFRVNGTLKKTVYTFDGYLPPWSWDTTSLGDSLPTLNATRYDLDGSKGWDQLVVKVNNLPPSAAWLAPGNATRAQGNVTLVARATDFHGIDRAEFYVDGVLRGTVAAANAGPDNYSWVWNSLSFSSGWHTLKAIARDFGGLKSAEVTRNLYVDNNLGIAIQRPTATDYYTGTVAVVANVEDTSVTTKVEFRVDGVLKATSTTPIGGNYTWNWTTANEDALRVINVTQYDPVGPGAWYQVTVRVDNLPPTAVWMSPLNQDTVRDTVTLKVSAADFYGIQRVRFYADENLVGEDTAPDPGTNYFTAVWDTAQYCHNDLHILSAMAIENTALAKSATDYVQVFTDTDPLVCITNPADQASVWGVVNVNTTTTSARGISRVQFLLGYNTAAPILKYTDYFAPYTWAWDTSSYPYGPFEIQVVAFNNVGKSDDDYVTVNHIPPPGGSASASEAAPSQQGSTPTATLGILTSDWPLGETDDWTRSTVVVDLTGSPANITPAERAAGLVRPGLPATLFTSNLQWRLVVRDWVPGIAGNVTAFILRFEAKSDPQNPDTDRDGIPDGTEVNFWHTLPVARDSDVDGLEDSYEIAPHSETVTANGVTTILAPHTTDPARWDTDGDGLGDGQERGFVSYGTTKVIGEVGTVSGLTASWTTVYLRNHYTAPVVIAEPASFSGKAMSHVRIQTVTDHTFQLKMEKWVTGGSGAPESVAYLVLESGDHILPDGSFVEVGSANVTTAPTTVAFRESYWSTAPYVLVQTQTTRNGPTALIANRTALNWTGSFGVQLNGNGSTNLQAETVGYVAISPQSDSRSLATWTRTEVSFSASQIQGNWSYPAKFAQTQAPLILGWMGPEASKTNHLGLRLVSTTNASARVLREQSGTSTAGKVDFFAFAGPMNLTARMTTKANGTSSADTDGDGLADGVEVSTYGSNPTLTDTDADGIPDGIEVTLRTMNIPINGTMKTITFRTSPTSDDTDADGVKDPDELAGVLDHRLLFYDMSTTIDGTHLRDLSGNGNTGTMTGTTTGIVKVGGARDFDGSDDEVVATVPGMSTLGAWSFSFWFQWDNGASAAAYQHLIGFGSGHDATVYIAKASKTLCVKVTDALGVTVVDEALVAFTSRTSTQAHHVAATFDGTTLRAVVDGVEKGPWSASALKIRTDSLKIGTSGAETGNFFDGRIDEVQLWDRTLSAAEVASYYNLTSSPAAVVAWLDFETRTSSGDLFDFGGNLHAGAVTGTKIVEGRSGLGRGFSGGSDGIVLSGTDGVLFSNGASVSLYVLAPAFPANDTSLVSRKGSFYLNLTSDGHIQWSNYKAARLTSPLPIPLNRWVRVSAMAGASGITLLLDGSVVASGPGAAPPTPAGSPAVVLGYAEGSPHLSGSLDEVLVLNTVPSSSSTLADFAVRGIVLNPNGPDTDGDGLTDGQELFVRTGKTPMRTPLPDQAWTWSDPIALARGGPAWAIASATLMTGFTHPDMGEVTAQIVDAGPIPYQRYAYLRWYANAGEANNFTSYDLFALGYARDELAWGGPWYAYAYDRAQGKTGQLEYAQIQFTMHTLPNRADTDNDGLNDSEEANLGSDGFATNPWKADTDADGISDGLESNGWAWSGSTIVSDPNGVKTDPTRADTDRDGVPDNRDRAPLGDLFVEVSINSIAVTGSDSHNGGTPRPFVEASILGNNTYTIALGSASGSWTTTDPFTLNTYPGHRLAVNVPDDATSVTVTLSAWSYDTRTTCNGGPCNNHSPIVVSSHWEVLGGTLHCLNDGTASIAYDIQAPGQGNTYALRGCDPPENAALYASPLSVTLTTIVPNRVRTYLVIPDDYSALYNVTDASGSLVSRRYVGEPRFVALLLNETTWNNDFHCYCGPAQADVILVPRSVFFDTRLYADLSAGNLVSPLDKLSFRQNATSVLTNADDIQEVFTGNVTSTDVLLLLDLLEQNATGAVVHLPIALGNDLFLYSLSDGAVRIVGYRPTLTAPSMPYTFCTSSCDPPPPKPWWEQLWDGLVSVVTAFVVSAVILAITAFRMVAAVLSQVGNWLAQQVSGAIQAVKSAVQAAAKVLEQLASWVESFIVGALSALFERNFNVLRGLMMEYSQSSAAGVLSAQSETHASGNIPGSTSAQFANSVFLAPFAILSMVLSVAMVLALMVVTSLLLTFPFVIPVLPFVISSVVCLAFTGLIPAPRLVTGLPLTPDFDSVASLSRSLVSEDASPSAAAERAELVELIANLLKAIAGIAAFAVFLTAVSGASFIGFFYGMLSLAFVAGATMGITLHWDRTMVLGLAVIAIVLGIAGMVFDAIGLVVELVEFNLGGIVATAAAFLLSAMAISLSLAALSSV